MIRFILAVTLNQVLVDSFRFNQILRRSSHFSTKAEVADPYGWEPQTNPVSKHSCYSLNEETLPHLETIRDSKCVGFSESDSKCRGGFPFYRFSGGPAECSDCMDASRCQMMCLSKSMDAAALILNKKTGAPAECRCGATKENLGVWGMLGGASDGHEINFGPVHGLLPPTPMSAVADDDPRCAMYIYTYSDLREADGRVPTQFVETTSLDDFYIRSIVSGMKDPGDVEDATVEEMAKVNLAMRQRLMLWTRENPTGRVPRDEVFVEQVEPLPNRQQPVACKAVDEEPSCFDAGMDAVFAANGVTRSMDSHSPGLNMILTLSFEDWRFLFGVKNSQGQSHGYKRSSYCNSAKSTECQISCGTCELYDRPGNRASMYEPWVRTHKDESTGIVTIPYVLDASNPRISSDMKSWVSSATRTWAEVSCVNFQQVTSAPPDRHYVSITVDTDAAGNPSGCLANPVGLPENAHTPSTISVGGCPSNKLPLGSIVHEFGHVLGLAHTQMRPDRHDYIRINPNVIKAGYEPNFVLAPYGFDGSDGAYSPYDYGSIMHYTKTQAADKDHYNANDPESDGTFKLLRPIPSGISLGQRTALSALDIAEVNMVYECKNVKASAFHRDYAVNPAEAGGQGPSTKPKPATVSTTSPPVAASSTAAPAKAASSSTTKPPVASGSAGSSTRNAAGTATGTSTGTTTTKSSSAWSSAIPTVEETNSGDKEWENWEEDLDKVSNAINSVMRNNNVNLSARQLDRMNDLLSQEQAAFKTMDNAMEKQVVPATWRNDITAIAKVVLDIITEARVGILKFEAGKNPDQEGILDNASIDDLKQVIDLTKVLYSKMDAYVRTLPGHVSVLDAVELHHPSPIQTVVMYG